MDLAQPSLHLEAQDPVFKRDARLVADFVLVILLFKGTGLAHEWSLHSPVDLSEAQVKYVLFSEAVQDLDKV